MNVTQYFFNDNFTFSCFYIYLYVSLLKERKIKQNSMRQNLYITSPMNQQNWNNRPMSICLSEASGW